MPLINQNTGEGLKPVNGARYTALEAIFDKKFPGHPIYQRQRSPFRLASEQYLSGSHQHENQMTEEASRSAKRLDPLGPPCTVAFAPTDNKVPANSGGRAEAIEAE
jgi:hypothetical protein